MSLDLRKIAAFIYFAASAPGVWPVAGAQLDACRARPQKRRWRTFLAGILGARAALDGAGGTRAPLSSPGPMAGAMCAPGSFACVVRCLLERSAQSWARKRLQWSGRSRAMVTAANGRSGACLAVLRWVRLSHDVLWVGINAAQHRVL